MVTFLRQCFYIEAVSVCVPARVFPSNDETRRLIITNPDQDRRVQSSLVCKFIAVRVEVLCEFRLLPAEDTGVKSQWTHDH